MPKPKVKIKTGSLEVEYLDSIDNTRKKVFIDLPKVMGRIRKFWGKIKNAISQFVDWVKENKRIAITCAMLAGVVIIVVVAGVWVGVASLELGYFLFPLTIAIICLIFDVVSLAGSFEEVAEKMARRGIRFI